MSEPSQPAAGELVDRRVEANRVLELRRRGDAYEVWVEGELLLGSDTPRCEQSLAELALAPLGGRDDIRVLLAGLGTGRTVRALLNTPGVIRVDVVEPCAAIVEWEARYFAAVNGDVSRDPRAVFHRGDLQAFLKRLRLEEALEPWLAIVVDLSGQLERAAEAYAEERLIRLTEALRPGGVLALWSKARDQSLLVRLANQLQNLAEIAVPVDFRGEGQLDYVYRGRRPPAPREVGSFN